MPHGLRVLDTRIGFGGLRQGSARANAQRGGRGDDAEFALGRVMRGRVIMMIVIVTMAMIGVRHNMRNRMQRGLVTHRDKARRNRNGGNGPAGIWNTHPQHNSPF